VTDIPRPTNGRQPFADRRAKDQGKSCETQRLTGDHRFGFSATERFWAVWRHFGVSRAAIGRPPYAPNRLISRLVFITALRREMVPFFPVIVILRPWVSRAQQRSPTKGI
jgi:hypothetical protein